MPNDIRISGKDLKQIEELQKKLSGAVEKVDARTLERVGTDIAGKINAGVKKLLTEIDKVRERLGFEAGSVGARRLQSGLEAVEGATGAVQGLAPYAALLVNSPYARIGLLGAAAVVGGIEGAGRDYVRRQIGEMVRADVDATVREARRLLEIDLEIERRKQAVKNAGKVRG
jgi:hypothetical protein